MVRGQMLDLAAEKRGEPPTPTVARLQLTKLNAQLSSLTDEQARYIGVDKSGPYKPDHYRY